MVHNNIMADIILDMPYVTVVARKAYPNTGAWRMSAKSAKKSPKRVW